MTTEEFKKFKFGHIRNGEYVEGTGDKICVPHGGGWGEQEYAIALAINKGMFTGLDEDGNFSRYSLQANWGLYQEKEFDWDAKGFWAKGKEDIAILWFEKQSENIWAYIDLLSDESTDGKSCPDINNGQFSKWSIVKYFIPCPAPSNAEDYFE